jgi:hypothetical protein
LLLERLGDVRFKEGGFAGRKETANREDNPILF